MDEKKSKVTIKIKIITIIIFIYVALLKNPKALSVIQTQTSETTPIQHTITDKQIYMHNKDEHFLVIQTPVMQYFLLKKKTLT